MDKRKLGKTGEELSVVGFGGIIVMDETAVDSARFVSCAVDRGVNYFDVAPSYGNAQDMLGPALEPHRKGVFLACKTGEKTREAAEAELHGSLKALRTDRFDLYQHHALTTEEDITKAFGPGGSHEAFVAAKKAGKVRFLGFSAHSEWAALKAMELYRFDSILFPVNKRSWDESGFGPRVLEKAKSLGMGILALKALGGRALAEGEERPWPKCWYAPVETYAEAKANLEFTLAKPVTAAVSPSHIELFTWACDAAEGKDSSIAVAPRKKAVGRVEPIFPTH